MTNEAENRVKVLLNRIEGALQDIETVCNQHGYNTEPLGKAFESVQKARDFKLS